MIMLMSFLPLQVGTTVPESPDVSTEAAKVATVKLIQPICVPADHVNLVHASVDNLEFFGSVCLFEPCLLELHCKGVAMYDELGDATRAMTLLMNNQGVEPVQLELNVIGHFKLARLVKATSDVPR